MLITNTQCIIVLCMNTYFEYVRRHRKLLNLTQSEYAKRYGVTQGLVSAIERGNRTLPNQIAIDVAKAFFR